MPSLNVLCHIKDHRTLCEGCANCAVQDSYMIPRHGCYATQWPEQRHMRRLPANERADAMEHSETGRRMASHVGWDMRAPVVEEVINRSEDLR